VAAVLAAALGGRVLLRRSPTVLAPVEVLALRIDGEDARVEVIDSSRAGSIVVVARPDGAASGNEGGVRR
jgi:hypothetical protein